MSSVISFGERNKDQDPARLLSARGRAIVAATARVEGFSVVELRHTVGNELADVIVVESWNREVPSRNTPGILVTEELAIVVPVLEDRPPEVRALRSDFPAVAHLNDVPRREPASLCLYFEPWSAVERTWTPERLLQRILWWIASTAKGTLHRNDQPLERLYYASPFELVLPPDFHEKVADPKLRLDATFREHEKGGTLRTVFSSRDDATSTVGWTPLTARADAAIVHGRVELPAHTLGELEEQLRNRGSGLVDGLRARVLEMVTGGIPHREGERCLVVLSLQLRRSPESEPEDEEVLAFAVPISLAELGLALGALYDPEYEQRAGREAVPGRKYYAAQVLGGGAAPPSSKWRDIPLSALSVAPIPSKGFARLASGVREETAEFRGVLAGVGALGGCLGDLWAKAAWGTWTLIDHDLLRSHNVVRHVGRELHVGVPKVLAVQHVMQANYAKGYYSAHALASSARSMDEKVTAAISEAQLLVDASTTFEVPRDLARREPRPRIASLFLTPSARDSVILLEDQGHRIPIDALEAQYYRAVVTSPWGPGHLAGHKGELWIGAGCRDVSQVLSFGVVQLHAAILAEQLRKLVESDAARICVWSSDENGSVSFSEVVPRTVVEVQRGGWRVLLDEGTHAKLVGLRHARLPVETGGVILGYVDHKTHTIAVVDVLPAPSDSLETQSGFVRGVEGLAETLARVSELTAKVVRYIGEWHSHPPFSSPSPSGDDRELLATLRAQLEQDGDPVVMLIVGAAGEIGVHVNGIES